MRNPLYGFLAFLIVEALLGFGILSPDQQEDAEHQIYLLIDALLGVSTLVGYKLYTSHHKHQVEKEAEREKNTQTITVVKSGNFTEDQPLSIGRPPEQQFPSNSSVTQK